MAAGVVVAVAGAMLTYSQQQAAGRKADRIARLQAEEQKKRTDYELFVKRKQTEQLISKQKAAFAASGVSAEGTPMAVIEATERDAQQEQAEIRRRGYASSDMYIQEGSAVSDMYKSQAWGSLIRGAGQAYSSGYDAGYWGNVNEMDYVL